MRSILLTAVQAGLALFLYFVGAVIIGASLFPAVIFVVSVWQTYANEPELLRVLYVCIAAAIGYFIFGLTLVLAAGLLRMILNIQLKEGDHAIGSIEMIKWYFVNALFLCVRNVFMDFILLTPFCSLFYRMMGSKLGRNVQINSKNVADHSLLEIGNNSVIGGNATVIGHLFESKGLRLAKVIIGKNVIVGLNAVIMPGVIVGDGVVIAAGAIVPKNTVIEPNSVFYSTDRIIKKH